ncbi:hypothetical protein BJV82DRAFT_665541 [Fennellomyces sp. T-0311]|nr:hypothetical protein BJV82DRAFT_665541 [Fennellomyces sp. T-0311]
MAAKSDNEQQRYFPRLPSWVPSLSFTHRPQTALGSSLHPGQDQHHFTRQFSQGPWWASFYRRNTVAPETTVKKGDTMSQRQLSTVIRGGPLIESWFRHPLDWVSEVRQQQECVAKGGQCNTSISSSSRSSISSTSTVSTVLPSLSESTSTEDPSRPKPKQPGHDLEMLIVWLVAHTLLQTVLCLAPEAPPAVKKERTRIRTRIQYVTHRADLHSALAVLKNSPSSNVEIPACWPPLTESKIITSAAQAIGPRIASLWAEHEQSMALYKEQFPVRPTERRNWMRKQRAGPIKMSSNTTNDPHIMNLAREALEYFEQWYGEQQPDSPEMKTINWLRQVTVA